MLLKFKFLKPLIFKITTDLLTQFLYDEPIIDYYQLSLSEQLWLIIKPCGLSNLTSTYKQECHVLL